MRITKFSATPTQMTVVLERHSSQPRAEQHIAFRPFGVDYVGAEYTNMKPIDEVG